MKGGTFMNQKPIFNNKFFFNDNFYDNESDKSNELDEQYSYSIPYSLIDDRVWTSNIEDIDGGDNFADYCEYIFNLLEEEEYYD